MSRGFILAVVFDYLGQIHGVGAAMDNVAAAVGRAGFMSHGVDNAQQGVGKRHAGQTLSVVHPVAGLHIAVVGFNQVVVNHLDGVEGQPVGVIAVSGGYISLNGVGHGVHTGMGRQLLGHFFRQIRVHNGHVRGDIKVGQRIFNALLVIGDDAEGGDFRGCAGGRRNGAEPGFCPQGGEIEGYRQLVEGGFRVFVESPHGFGRVDGGSAAHGHNPIRLELPHLFSAPHNGLH